MLYVFRRRRFRKRFLTIFTILGIFLIISFLIHPDPVIRAIESTQHSDPRLYCVLVHRDLKDEQFIYINNITWAKRCHRIGIVKYKRSSTSDSDFNITQSPYHVNLWTHILATIRQTISSYEYITDDDLMVIVPAATFVFQEKLQSFLRNFTHNPQLPLVIIYEYQDINAYILNGQAIYTLRHTKVLDLCLEQSYPSARETHLWKCMEKSLQNEYLDFKCEHKRYFTQYYHNRLTISHIKNGFCLENKAHICRSVALLYPATLDDIITLEFFKYRLKSTYSHISL